MKRLNTLLNQSEGSVGLRYEWYTVNSQKGIYFILNDNDNLYLAQLCYIFRLGLYSDFHSIHDQILPEKKRTILVQVGSQTAWSKEIT